MSMQNGMGYGLLYNFYAASGGTGNKDIAPTGWRVPTGTTTGFGGTNEYVSGGLYTNPKNKVYSSRQVSGTTYPTDIHPRWNATGGSNTMVCDEDVLGASILPAGFYDNSLSTYYSLGSWTYFWTQSWEDLYSNSIRFSNIGLTGNGLIGKTDNSDKNDFYNIRCIMEDPSGWKAGDTVTDVEGNVYSTFQIDGNVWMAENLRTTKYNDGTDITYSSGGTLGSYRYPDGNSAYVYEDSIAPSGLTSSNIDYTTATVSWSNNWSPTVTGGTNNLVQYWISGDTWTTFPQGTLSTTATTVNLTGLTAGASYVIRVVFVDDNNWYNTLGSTSFTMLGGGIPKAPSGLTTSNLTCDGWDLSWTNSGEQGTIEVWWLDLSIPSWVKFNDYPIYTNNMTFTGMSYNQDGLGSTSVRVSNVVTGTSYTSDNLTGVQPALPAAPTNLTGTTTGCTSTLLTWTNAPCTGTLQVYQLLDGGDILLTTLNNQETSYEITGILPPEDNTYQVINETNSTFYASVPWNYVSPFTCYNIFPFCSLDDKYTIVDATCSNMDGLIILNDDYIEFYDFVLTDLLGTEYTLWTDRFYVTAGWYTLTASVKEAYWGLFGRDNCVIDWIEINNTDTTITMDSKSVRDASCGTFGATTGRIVYFCSDSYAGSDYDCYLFNEKGDTVDFRNVSDISQLIYTNLVADNYYLMILNNNGANGGCRLLNGVTQLKNLNNMSVAGIKRIFVTEWNNLVEYNYWTATDEDYFVSGLDSDFFSSIKIKEFDDSTLPSAWYEIVMDTKGATFGQKMNKSKQGFIFTDTLTLSIPHADNAKWKSLIDFLSERHIVVFQDNNNQFWCMGYRLGATVDGYKRADNQYILTLNAVSDNKILTNIDKDYVVNNIINQ